MKPTEDVRKRAAEQGSAEEEALKKWMEAKSKEFAERETNLEHCGQRFANSLAEQRRNCVPNLLHHLRTIPGKLKLIVE